MSCLADTKFNLYCVTSSVHIIVLFPESHKVLIIAFVIRLDKGVIVYICDSRGVRDIYDTDGSNATAASEPLVVLVWQFFHICL